MEIPKPGKELEIEHNGVRVWAFVDEVRPNPRGKGFYWIQLQVESRIPKGADFRWPEGKGWIQFHVDSSVEAEGVYKIVVEVLAATQPQPELGER